MPPEQDEGGLLQRTHPFVDQGHDGLEGRSPSLGAIWVLVAALVVGEERFANGGRVGVLTTEDRPDAQLEQVFLDLLGAVVGSVVQQQNSVGTPVRILRGENLSEAGEEHQHDVRVRVDLCQRDVEVPLRVHGGDHVDPVAELLRRDGVVAAPLAPLLAAEVQRGEPRLVDVDHALALVEELQQCSVVKHPHENRSYAMALIDVKA